MWKEIIIIITILIIVVSGEFITQNNTKKSIEDVIDKIDLLIEDILNEKYDSFEINKKYSDILNTWDKYYEVLSFYIEHDELEKVKTEFVALKANIDVEEYEKGLEELSKSRYILEHIQSKEQVCLKNIF